MQIRFWCPEWADELRSLQIQKCNLNIGFFFYIGLDRNTIYVVVLVKWLLRCQYGIWQDSCLLSTSVCVCVCVLVAQSCPTLCHPLDCSPPGFSAHGIFQTRIMEWVALPSSMGSFPIQGLNPRLLHCRWSLYCWATREASNLNIPTLYDLAVLLLIHCICKRKACTCAQNMSTIRTKTFLEIGKS